MPEGETEREEVNRQQCDNSSTGENQPAAHFGSSVFTART
jgi:hypothetical protein